MVVLDSDLVCAMGQSGTMALLVLYKVELHQTASMFCKSVNPVEGKKHARVWCPLVRRSDRSQLRAHPCCPLSPLSPWAPLHGKSV